MAQVLTQPIRMAARASMPELEWGKVGQAWGKRGAR